MDRYEKSAEWIMKFGDDIIAEKKRKAGIIRNIAFSVSGVCAAALICFGIWKTPALQKPPEIPQLPEISAVTTTVAETAATEKGTVTTASNIATAEEKATAASDTSAADVQTTAATTEARPASSRPAGSMSVNTAVQPEVQTRAAETAQAIIVSITEKATTSTLPVATRLYPQGDGDLTTATDMPEVAPPPCTTTANSEVIELPSTPDDPYGIRAICREFGVIDIAPDHMPDGFKLVQLERDDQWYEKTLWFEYLNAENGSIELTYKDTKGNPPFQLITTETEGVIMKEINGYTFRYTYESSESTLFAEYTGESSAILIRIDGISQQEAERVITSISKGGT